VQHLAQGQTAVWVLLETGDKDKDAAALARLTKGLEQAKTSLTLPQIDPQEQEKWTGNGKTPLKIDFRLVRVARSNAQEVPLITMLVKSHPEMMQRLQEPLAFPVFGRGRSLLGLAGDDITAESVVTACRFFVDSCQCTLKEENPGVDLLLAADWDKACEALPPVQTPKAMLTSVTDFLDGAPGTPVQTATLAEPSVPARVSSPVVAGAIVLALGLVIAGTWTWRLLRTSAERNTCA
jgi:hypothetical protein